MSYTCTPHNSGASGTASSGSRPPEEPKFRSWWHRQQLLASTRAQSPVFRCRQAGGRGGAPASILTRCSRSPRQLQNHSQSTEAGCASRYGRTAGSQRYRHGASPCVDGWNTKVRPPTRAHAGAHAACGGPGYQASGLGKQPEPAAGSQPFRGCDARGCRCLRQEDTPSCSTRVAQWQPHDLAAPEWQHTCSEGRGRWPQSRLR